jgi:hypothetical protein
MTRRQPGVFGGEYRDPNKDCSAWAARVAFMNTITEVSVHVPVALRSVLALPESPLPAVHHAAGRASPERPAAPHLRLDDTQLQTGF